MNVRNAIPLDQVCRYFNIEVEIVRDFAEFGLFPTISDDGETGIEPHQLEKVARIISLYQALGINKEGIEVISALRDRIHGLEDEIERLRFEVEKLEGHLRGEAPEALSRLGLLIDIQYR